MLPAGPEGRALLGKISQLALERCQSLLGGLVGLLLQRLSLDLELTDLPLELVEFRRHRVDFSAQPRGGLVDEVDRLVGKEAVGDVAV